MRRSAFTAPLIAVISLAMNTSQAQTPDSINLALANRLLDVVKYDTQVERITAVTQLHDPSPQAREAAKAHREFQLKYFTPEVLRPPLARRIAELYTDAELRELIAFHESTLGQKWVELQPRHAEALGPAIAEIYREHFAEFQAILFKGVVPSPPE